MATLADRKDNKAKDGKSKKKGRIFVDWEKIGAVQVTPEGGKYAEWQLGIKPTPKQRRESDWAGRLERLSTAMCYLTEWCWEPLLDMHPEDKIATHDILVFADENGICAEVVKALKTEWPGGDEDDIGYGSKWGRGGCGAGRVKVVKKSMGELSERKIKRELDQGWDMVIVGYGMDLPTTNAVEDVAKKQADTLKFLFDLGKIMVADPDLVKKLAVLTSDVFSDAKQLHDEYGLGVVTNATFEGFLNCLRVELETLPILHLDLDWYLDDAMMEHVALELFRPGLFGANQVRLGAKGRYCARLMSHHKYAVAPQKDQPWLDETTKFESYLKPHLYTEGVVALSGGNGALAMVMTLFLIEKMGASKSSATTKFLFLSRSAKIPAEQESMWKNVQAAIAGTASPTSSTRDCRSSTRTRRRSTRRGPRTSGPRPRRRSARSTSPPTSSTTASPGEPAAVARARLPPFPPTPRARRGVALRPEYRYGRAFPQPSRAGGAPAGSAKSFRRRK